MSKPRNYTHAQPLRPDADCACDAVYIGNGGALKVTTAGGDIVTFAGLATCFLLEVAIKHVWKDGTTASGLIGLR